MKVTWRDAQHTDTAVPDYLKSMDCICDTVGWVVNEDTNFLTIARDRYEHSCMDSVAAVNEVTEECSCFIRIPKVLILKRQALNG